MTAAKILISMEREAGIDESPADSSLVGLVAIALRGFLPQLAGQLAIDVADVRADPKSQREATPYRG